MIETLRTNLVWRFSREIFSVQLSDLKVRTLLKCCCSLCLQQCLGHYRKSF